jgi:hypothetical protein
MPIYHRWLSQHVHADAARWFCLFQGNTEAIHAQRSRESSDARCGTHLTTRRSGLPAAILKVGTLDDPALFGTPQMAIFTIDKQAFHQIPEGLPSFERLPKR